MFSLDTGKYTGKITKSLNIDGNIITNTHYSRKESNCDWHYHENPHISFIIKGGDSESRRSISYERKVGNIFFYHAGEKHRTVSGQKTSKNFNIEFGKNFLNRFEFSEAQIDKAVNENLDVKFLLLKIQQELLFNEKANSTAINTLLLKLVSQSTSIYNGSTPNWVLTLYELLNDRWNEQITLNELASATHVHPITISKHFRRYFTCTLGEYLRKLKIDRSISLINNAELTLTDIAFRCGFSDQSHFTRTFKQITGFLPKDFRNI